MATFDIDVLKTKACVLTLDEDELYLLRNIVAQFRPESWSGTRRVYALAGALSAAVLAMQRVETHLWPDDQPYPSCGCDDCIPNDDRNSW